METTPKTAQMGNEIEILKGEHKGPAKVLVVRENSVIAEIGKNTRTGEPVATVVNHKNYKIKS